MTKCADEALRKFGLMGRDPNDIKGKITQCDKGGEKIKDYAKNIVSLMGYVILK